LAARLVYVPGAVTVTGRARLAGMLTLIWLVIVGLFVGIAVLAGLVPQPRTADITDQPVG